MSVETLIDLGFDALDDGRLSPQVLGQWRAELIQRVGSDSFAPLVCGLLGLAHFLAREVGAPQAARQLSELLEAMARASLLEGSTWASRLGGPSEGVRTAPCLDAPVPAESIKAGALAGGARRRIR